MNRPSLPISEQDITDFEVTCLEGSEVGNSFLSTCVQASQNVEPIFQTARTAKHRDSVTGPNETKPHKKIIFIQGTELQIQAVSVHEGDILNLCIDFLLFIYSPNIRSFPLRSSSAAVAAHYRQICARVYVVFVTYSPALVVVRANIPSEDRSLTGMHVLFFCRGSSCVFLSDHGWGEGWGRFVLNG